MSPDRRDGPEDPEDFEDPVLDAGDGDADLGDEVFENEAFEEDASDRSRPSSEEFDAWGNPLRARRTRRVPGRRLVIVAVVILLAVGIVVAGALLPSQQAKTEVSAAPLVGRTSAVCPSPVPGSNDQPSTGQPSTDQPSTGQPSSPQPSTGQPSTGQPSTGQPSTGQPTERPSIARKDRPSASITAVTIRQAPDRDGVLTGTPLGGGDPLLKVDQQGFGAQVAAPDAPVLLQGVGVMSTASSGAILARADSGDLVGLSAAPCTAPSTSQWFVGLGAETNNRTELVLSNPDDAQAEVDLRFFGQSGRVVVPGSPGLIVPAHDSRTVSLESLVAQAGPLSVWVRATAGRVSAMAQDLHSVGLTPAGADWHPASVGPRRTVVIPGVPEGAGARDLYIVNPGTTRAVAAVSVLGASGAFSPVGAEQVEVPPESTVSVSLDSGLAGQGAGVSVSADQPISASVISASLRTDSGSPTQPDIAVQPATVALGRRGVSPIAAVSGADGTLMLSNGGDVDTSVSFSVVNLSGVTLRQDTMLVPAHGTSTRLLDSSAGTSYVEVEVPDGAQIYGAADFVQSDGPIAGLTSIPISSPDLASRSRAAVQDPAVGR